MGQDIRRHRTAVYEVNRSELLRITAFTVKTQIAHITDSHFTALMLKRLFKNIKFIDRRIFQKIYNRHTRQCLRIMRIFPVDLQCLIHPGVKQFVGMTGMRLCELPICQTLCKCQIQLTILIHRTRSICIKFTELKIPGLFIQKQIDPRHRNISRIQRLLKDQLLQLLRETKQRTVVCILHVMCDHFIKNTVQFPDQLIKHTCLPVCKQLRHIERTNNTVMIFCCRLIQIILDPAILWCMHILIAPDDPMILLF